MTPGLCDEIIMIPGARDHANASRAPGVTIPLRTHSRTDTSHTFDFFAQSICR